MTELKFYKDKDYEKYMTSPSELIFICNEKDLIKVVSLHLSDNVGENINILNQLKNINLEKTTLIETNNNGKLLYLINQCF